MMLSKMKLDAGSVRVFAAILCALIVQVCAEEQQQQVPTDMDMEVPLATGVPLTGMRLGSSVGMLLAAGGAHTLTYLYGKDVSTVWTYSSYALSGFTFLVMIFEAVLGNYMAVPLYSSLFVLPYAAVLGAAVTGGVNKIGFMSKSGIFANLGVNDNPNKPPATKTDIENAFKNKEGEAAVKELVKLSATKDIKFGDFIPETIAFVKAILKKDTEKTEFEGDNLKLVKAALEALKDKGQDLCNADSDSQEYKDIQEIFAKSEEKLRIGKGKDALHTFKKGEKKKDDKKDENVDYAAKLKEAIKTPKADTHCELIVDAWLAYNGAKGKKDDKLLEQIKELYGKVVELLDADKFPRKDAAEATKNIAGLRKIVKSLVAAQKKDSKNTCTYKALAVKDKTEEETFAFDAELKALNVVLVEMLTAIVADKIENDKDIKAYDLVTKDAKADTYDDKTVSSKFIVEFNKVMELVKDDDVTFDKVGGDAVVAHVKSHVDAVIELIKAAAGKTGDQKEKTAGKKLYDSLKDVKTEKFDGTDLFKKDLMDLLTAVDPAAARAHVCDAAVKAAAEVVKSKADDVSALVDALIAAAEVYGKYNDKADKKDADKVRTEMNNVKKAITAAVGKLLKLEASDENKGKLDAAKLVLENADIPTADKLVDGGKNNESSLKAELEKVVARIAEVDIVIPFVKQTALLNKDKATFDELCTAIKSASGEYAGSVADDKHNKLKEFKAMADALKTKSTSVLATITTAAGKTGNKAPKTSAELKTLRDMIESAKKINGLKKDALNIDKTADAYYDAKIAELTVAEEAAFEATVVELEKKYSKVDAKALEKVTLLDLIKNTLEIIDVVPASKNLKTLGEAKESDFTKACKGLIAYVKLVDAEVTRQCTAANGQKAASLKLLAPLTKSDPVILASDAADYAGISKKKLDNTEDVLFKAAIDPVITKSKTE